MEQKIAPKTNRSVIRQMKYSNANQEYDPDDQKIVRIMSAFTSVRRLKVLT